MPRLRSPARCGSLRRDTSTPLNEYDPDVGRSRHPTMCRRVDFPDPDGPTIATHSPGHTRSSTPRSASTAGSTPYRRHTSLSSTTGAAVVSGRAIHASSEADHHAISRLERSLDGGHFDEPARGQPGFDSHELEPVARGSLDSR